MRGGRLVRRFFGAVGLVLVLFAGCLFLTPMGRAARAVNAENLYAAHDLNGAEAQSRAALKDDPHNTRAHFVLGRVLFDRGRAEEAAAEYRLASASEPDNEVFQLALAQALAAGDRDLDGALAASTRALEIKPDSADAKTMLAQITKRRETKKREADVARADELLAEADDACGFNAGFRGPVLIDPDFSSCSCDLQKVIPAYEHALALDGSSLDAHRHLGIVLSRARQFEKAAKVFAEAVRLEPQEPDYRNEVATALELAGDVAAAEVALLEAAGEWPSANAALPPGARRSVFIHLAELSLRAGRRQAAIEYYGMAARRDSSRDDLNTDRLNASFNAQQLSTPGAEIEVPRLSAASCYRVN